MKHSHWIILGLLLAAPLSLTATYAREFFAVDSALDAGASYDYWTGRADFTQNHPYIPFSERHGTLLTVSGWSMLGAIGYTIVIIVRRKRADTQ